MCVGPCETIAWLAVRGNAWTPTPKYPGGSCQVWRPPKHAVSFSAVCRLGFGWCVALWHCAAHPPSASAATSGYDSAGSKKFASSVTSVECALRIFRRSGISPRQTNRPIIGRNSWPVKCSLPVRALLEGVKRVGLEVATVRDAGLSGLHQAVTGVVAL